MLHLIWNFIDEEFDLFKLRFIFFLHFKCYIFAMNGAHNYHKKIKIYVLQCTTIEFKQKYGQETSRRFKSHFTEKKIGQFFWRSQIMRLCIDVIWRHSRSCSFGCIYCREDYTDIYRVIGIILIAISPAIEIYRMGDNRRTVNQSPAKSLIIDAEWRSVRRWVRTFLITWWQKTRVKYCYVDLSSRYELQFAIICIDMSVILDLSTAIQQF